MAAKPENADEEGARPAETLAERLLGYLCLGLASLALLLVCATTFIDVFGRYVLSSPFSPATDVTELLMVLVIFCAMPVVALRGQNIAIDILDPYTPERLVPIRDCAIGLLGVAFFGVAAWRLLILAERAELQGSTTSYLAWPMAPVIFVMAAFCTLTAVAFLWVAARKITGIGP